MNVNEFLNLAERVEALDNFVLRRIAIELVEETFSKKVVAEEPLALPVILDRMGIIAYDHKILKELGDFLSIVFPEAEVDPLFFDLYQDSAELREYIETFFNYEED